MTKHRNLPKKYEVGFLQRMDFRTDLARRLNFTYGQIIDDAGGVENLPHAKLCLVERFCFLEEFLRQIEMELVKNPVGKPELLADLA